MLGVLFFLFSGYTMEVINSSILITTTGIDSKIKMTCASDVAHVIIKSIEKEKLEIFVGRDAKLMDKLFPV